VPFEVTMATKEIGASTTMMIVLFGCNALLWVFFQYVGYLDKSTKALASDDVASKDTVAQTGPPKKELSKPFTPTMDGFTFLTRDFAKLGFIMALTYVCENHWIFPHSQKEYSRDLFLVICVLFFLYGFYTIKPTKDLTLLSRDQTEEWKGWMQFIFLLYHCE